MGGKLRRRTALIIRAEEELGGPLEETLAPFLSDHGIAGTSRRLGVNKPTLQYWMAVLGIRTRYVALGPNDSMEIQRSVPEEVAA